HHVVVDQHHVAVDVGHGGEERRGWRRAQRLAHGGGDVVRGHVDGPRGSTSVQRRAQKSFRGPPAGREDEQQTSQDEGGAARLSPRPPGNRGGTDESQPKTPPEAPAEKADVPRHHAHRPRPPDRKVSGTNLCSSSVAGYDDAGKTTSSYLHDGAGFRLPVEVRVVDHGAVDAYAALTDEPARLAVGGRQPRLHQQPDNPNAPAFDLLRP